jgi:hypothetical protein
MRPTTQSKHRACGIQMQCVRCIRICTAIDHALKFTSPPAARAGGRHTPSHRSPFPMQPTTSPEETEGPAVDHHGNANPVARNLGTYNATGGMVPFVNRSFEWGAGIATSFVRFRALGIVPRRCARLTCFICPKLRGSNAVLITPQPVTLPPRSGDMRRTVGECDRHVPRRLAFRPSAAAPTLALLHATTDF